jgi:hypothetical protein
VEYGNVTQIVLFENDVHAVLMSGRNYDVIPPNGDCPRESNVQRHYRTQYAIDPPSDNAIRRWLNKFQEAGNALHRKGKGGPSPLQEDVDRIQESWKSYVL